MVTKLDRLARSLPDARAIADELTARQVRLNIGAARKDEANLRTARLVLHQAETAQDARQAWIDAHPDVADHIVDISEKIRRAKSAGRAQSGSSR